jgi:hypothetical protein
VYGQPWLQKLAMVPMPLTLVLTLVLPLVLRG